MKSISVYHFHNGTGGGVLSVIRNLLQFSNNPLIENHIIYTINKEQTPVFTSAPIAGAVTEQIFYYSPKWNFYYTCRQLAKLLPYDALVVAHDWLELGMMNNLGLQNPLVHFLHGDYDYYYQLAKVNQASIDLFITVAQNIEKKLGNVIPERLNDIVYLRFPVASIQPAEKEGDDIVNIIFIGRLETAKGYPLLPVIAKSIHEINSKVRWHIVGSAGEADNENISWDENIQVKFYGNIPNDAVFKLLKKMQLLLLPSLAEGMPVVLIEAMKAGVVALVNDIEGGIQELVINGETGYKIQQNLIAGYIERVHALTTDKDLLLKISNNAASMANEMFDPIINTKVIEEKLITTFNAKRKKKNAVKVYGSRLDQPWLPNIITYSTRKSI